jgi:hypothetical protein
MKQSLFALFITLCLLGKAFAGESASYTLSRFEMGVFSSKWGDPQPVLVQTSVGEDSLTLKYPSGIQTVGRKNFVVTPLMTSESDLSKILVAGGGYDSLTIGSRWENEFTAPPAPTSRCPHPVTSKMTSEITKIDDDAIEVTQKGTWTSQCGNGTGTSTLVISKDLRTLLSFEVSSFWGNRQVAGTRIKINK